MPRPDLTRVVHFFRKYINLTTEDELTECFKNNTNSYISFLQSIPESKYDYRYAADKWTIKEMLQHIIDAERIFAYRALCFARKDVQQMPNFDEVGYAANTPVMHRSWNDMIEEFISCRKATELLFNSFTEEQLQQAGSSGGGNFTYVLALGFTIAGHCNHHRRILEERYL